MKQWKVKTTGAQLFNTITYDIKIVTEYRFYKSETAEENRIARKPEHSPPGVLVLVLVLVTNSRNPCDWARHRKYPETQQMACAAHNIIRKYCDLLWCVILHLRFDTLWRAARWPQFQCVLTYGVASVV